MGILTLNGKSYALDDMGFLVDFHQWDENFVEAMAPRAQILNGLTKEHWQIIRHIRNSFSTSGFCPLVYETCRANNLRLHDLKALFPTGYLRGACLLAGIPYKEGCWGQPWLPERPGDAGPSASEKTYVVDVRGFLIDPTSWDERFVACKAYEMKMPDRLTARHWQVIHFLRDWYAKSGAIPTIYDTCEANHLELDELERLFPDGYHRCAVKLAGLRVR